MEQSNKLNIDTLIEALEAEKYGFDMSSWQRLTDTHPCGTVACIGGTAAMLMVPNFNVTLMPLEVFKWITKDLILAQEFANNDLFAPFTTTADYCEEYPDSPLYISRERAIAVLKHLRDTGEVDWDRFDNFGEVRS